MYMHENYSIITWILSGEKMEKMISRIPRNLKKFHKTFEAQNLFQKEMKHLKQSWIFRGKLVTFRECRIFFSACRFFGFKKVVPMMETNCIVRRFPRSLCTICCLVAENLKIYSWYQSKGAEFKNKQIFDTLPETKQPRVYTWKWMVGIKMNGLLGPKWPRFQTLFALRKCRFLRCFVASLAEVFGVTCLQGVIRMGINNSKDSSLEAIIFSIYTLENYPVKVHPKITQFFHGNIIFQPSMSLFSTC